MKDSTFSWCVIGMLASWCGVVALVSFLSAVVLIGSLRWTLVPALITAFVFCVCTELFISSLDDVRRTCGLHREWQDALPSRMAVAAVLAGLGVLWAGWYVCAVVAVGPRRWIQLPTIPAMFVIWLGLMVFVKTLCDRKAGAS